MFVGLFYRYRFLNPKRGVAWNRNEACTGKLYVHLYMDFRVSPGLLYTMYVYTVSHFILIVSPPSLFSGPRRRHHGYCACAYGGGEAIIERLLNWFSMTGLTPQSRNRARAY